jgi:hypothetical protein
MANLEQWKVKIFMLYSHHLLPAWYKYFGGYNSLHWRGKILTQESAMEMYFEVYIRNSKKIKQ